MNKNYVYADNAATTPMSDIALQAMLPYFQQSYANPSALYQLGRQNRQAIESARETLAACIHAHPTEIYITSGGTESDNWAIQSVVQYYKQKGKNHIITTQIEHPAVYNTVQALQKQGIEVTYLPVDHLGRIDLKELKDAITPQTSLVSIMYANNEVGTIQPIDEIGKICHEKGVLFHTDAVQAVGAIPIDVHLQNIDLLSASAHKFHGPKGIGFLYCKKSFKLENLFYGGIQERKLRPGTENVPYIVAMAKALEESCQMMNEKAKAIASLRDSIEQSLLELPNVYVNGDQKHRLPGILNLSFEGIDGQSLVFELDLKGVLVSTGSACHAGLSQPSHVLLAMGRSYPLAQSAIRISLGRYNSEQDAQIIINSIKEAIHYLKNREI
jgi:cysteine desulfurase